MTIYSVVCPKYPNTFSGSPEYSVVKSDAHYCLIPVNQLTMKIALDEKAFLVPGKELDSY